MCYGLQNAPLDRLAQSTTWYHIPSRPIAILPYPIFKLPKLPQVIGSFKNKRYQQKHSGIISANDVSQPHLNTHIRTSEEIRLVARGDFWFLVLWDSAGACSWKATERTMQSAFIPCRRQVLLTSWLFRWWLITFELQWQHKTIQRLTISMHCIEKPWQNNSKTY